LQPALETYALASFWESLPAAGYRHAAFELDGIEHWEDVALATGRHNVQISTRHGTFEVNRGSYLGHWRHIRDGKIRVALSIRQASQTIAEAGRNVQNFADRRNLGT
jgi:hypothetical protein